MAEQGLLMGLRPEVLGLGAGAGVTRKSTLVTQLRPTVFIGLGGTGLKVLARFRRRIFERYGEADRWDIYRFLAIDSDEGELAGRGVVNERGYPLRKQDTFFIGMDTQNVAAVMENLKGSYRHYDRWISSNILKFKNNSFKEGAQQTRAIGRMLFVNKIQEIHDLIADRVWKASNAATLERSEVDVAGDAIKTDIVIVASLAGGTGAGSFLDCALLAHSIAASETQRVGTVRGMLLLPDVFEDKVPSGQKPRIWANGYAALRELEYFNRTRRPLFDVSDWGVKLRDPGRVDLFSLCYLFSRQNASIREDYDNMFDLVADALVLTAGNSKLARRARGLWSNAETRYESTGWVTYEECNGVPDGGVEDNTYDEPQYGKFQLYWATRYSSLGIAKVTMKFPELCRLAAARLVRCIVESEMGVVTERSTDVDERVELMKRALVVPETLLPPNVISGSANMQKRALDTKVHGQAEMRAKELLGTLDRDIKFVHAVTEGGERRELQERNANADRVVREAEEQAMTQAKSINMPELLDRNVRRGISILEGLIAVIRDSQKKLDNRLPTTDEPIALEQWRDMDVNQMAKDSLLGSRAFRHVHAKHANWLALEVRKRLECLNRLIQRAFYAQMLQELEIRRDQLNVRLTVLQQWHDEFGEMQNKLAEQFQDSRNIVLTKNYVPSNDQDTDRLTALDGEINRAIAQDGTIKTLLDARAKILRQLPTDFKIGATPGTFGDLFQAPSLDAAEDFKTRIIDVIAWGLLKNLLGGRDIIQYVRQTKAEGEFHDAVERAMSQSLAFWPKTGFHPWDEVVSSAKLSAAPIPSAPDQLSRKLKEWVEPRGYGDVVRVAGNDEKAIAQAGEVVFLHDEHGFPLQSLGLLEKMKSCYDQVSQHSDISLQHFDKRFVFQGRLPELLAVRNRADADEIVRRRDIAFISILLRFFRWNEEEGQFSYSHDGASQAVGKTYLDVATWLRRTDPRVVDELERRAEEWFRSRQAKIVRRRGGSDDDPDIKADVFMLIVVERLLRLMSRRLYKTRVKGVKEIFPPEHTMLTRLRRRYLDGRFVQLDRLYFGNETGRRALEIEVEQCLHRYCQFVGAKDSCDDHDEEHDQRILQLCFPTRTPEDMTVIDEAWERGWFGTDDVDLIEVKSLFYGISDLSTVRSVSEPERWEIPESIQGAAKDGDGDPGNHGAAELARRERHVEPQREEGGDERQFLNDDDGVR